jgi:hypothetical protein
MRIKEVQTTSAPLQIFWSGMCEKSLENTSLKLTKENPRTTQCMKRRIYLEQTAFTVMERYFFWIEDNGDSHNVHRAIPFPIPSFRYNYQKIAKDGTLEGPKGTANPKLKRLIRSESFSVSWKQR